MYVFLLVNIVNNICFKWVFRNGKRMFYIAFSITVICLKHEKSYSILKYSACANIPHFIMIIIYYREASKYIFDCLHTQQIFISESLIALLEP